mgnify:CR=1 FL=1
MANKKLVQPRTKMVSATFTTEEFEAVQKAAQQTDRSAAALVRWATIRYLRELALLPGAEEENTNENASENAESEA